MSVDIVQSPNILPVPQEVTEHTLTFCHPADVVAFAQTCRPAYKLIFHSPDQHLWRQLFLLHPFDDPRQSLRVQDIGPTASSVNYDWKNELIRRMKAKATAFDIEDSAPKERIFALETFISMIQDALPVDALHKNKHSDNLDWVLSVMKDSCMLVAYFPHTETQLHAQLRSYFALSLDDTWDDKTKARLKECRTQSRCTVYNVRNYHPDNNWGPFFANQRINWVHVDSIINVILMNILELPAGLRRSPPTGLESTRAYSAPVGRRSPEDWAGIEGTWRRYVCFMDYRDLYAFNFSNMANGPRNAAFFADPSFREATRLIELKLKPVPRETLRFRTTRSDNSVAINPAYPPLFFHGTSRGLSGQPATVEGSVRMGHDGIARWHFATTYDGHTHWSSEGVQLGNIASAAGIVGSWTTDVHDPGDPVGPFWLWKVDEDYPYDLMEFT